MRKRSRKLKQRRIQLELLEDRRLLALLGVVPTFPSSFANSTGTVAYESASDSFQADATPLLFLESATSVPRFIQPPNGFELSIKVDNTGSLIGGVAGDDFSVTGSIDIDGDTLPDATGTLLTGEVTEFGFEDSATTDVYDFRFTPTGGQFLTGGALTGGGSFPAYFAGLDIGLRIDSEGSSFSGDFNVNFGGGNKATFGPIERTFIPPVPEVAIEKYTRVDVNPIDIEKLVRVESPAPGGDGDDLCAVHGKVVGLTYQYVPGTTVSTTQDAGKAQILFQGPVDDDGTSYVIVTDVEDAASALGGSGKRFFEGNVDVDGLFTANEDVDDFGSRTYIHFYDDSSGGVLQSVEYHTSCSQPINLNDVIGNATLVQFEGETSTSEMAGNQFGPGLEDDDADEPTGPSATAGDTVVFTYVVTNPIVGSEISNVEVTDLVLAPVPGTVFLPAPELKDNGKNVGDVDDDDKLDFGEQWLYTSTQSVDASTPVGQHIDKATVTGDSSTGPVMDMDPAHFVVPPSISEGDLCEVHGKVVGLTFEYDPGTTVNTAQDPAKADVIFDSGSIDDDGTSFVIVTDESDGASALGGGGKRFFEGDVAIGGTFLANEDVDDFGSTTYMHFYDDSTGGLLQTVVYHTSCSQPIQLGDVIGNARLVAYLGETGSAVLPPPVDPPIVDLDPGLMPGVVDDPFDSLNIGVDADDPTGPIAQIGDRVVFTYEVTNPGTVPLTVLSVFDDNETDDEIPGVGADDVEPDPVLKANGKNIGDDNDDGLLDPGEVWYYQASTIATIPGQHTNLAKVRAEDASQEMVMDDDPSNHLVNPLEFEKYVFVQSELPSEGDVCEVYGKPVALTFEYIPGLTVNTEQDPAKAAITFDSGAIDPDGTSFVIVTDESDAASALGGSGKRFFEGDVSFNELFEANESLGDFGSTTYVHFFDSSLGGVLQSIVYHTSCSQPIRLGDVVGNATLVEYDGEDGSVSLTPTFGLGDRADTPTGPFVVLDDQVVFNFVVSNTSAGASAIPLSDVVVTDTFDGTTVTVTDFVDKGNGDDILDPGETWILTLSRTADEEGQQMNLGTVTADTPDGTELSTDDPAYFFVEAIKFHVVDEKADSDFRYTKSGKGGGLSTALDGGNSQPRGAVSNATGDRVWVVDKDKHVYVYDGTGGFLGEWKAKGISDKVHGIASDGDDVWIVDDDKDRVYFYQGGASFAFDQDHDYTSRFDLDDANDKPRGITTDGTHLWVVDEGEDRVYKYTVSGTLVSSWALDGGNKKPRGLTIDPTGSSGNTIWVVDEGDKDEPGSVYTYADGMTNAGGGLSGIFSLAAGNTKPQGIADPDPDYQGSSDRSIGTQVLVQMESEVRRDPLASDSDLDDSGRDDADRAILQVAKEAASVGSVGDWDSSARLEVAEVDDYFALEDERDEVDVLGELVLAELSSI